MLLRPFSNMEGLMKFGLKQLCVFFPLLIAANAMADENLLGYTTGAETLPKGTSEAYLHLTHHGDKRYGDYSAQYLRAEYEYGITDRLTGAFYLNAYRHDYNCGEGCAGPINDREIPGSKDSFKLSGFSVELKKMLLSPYENDIGVSLYGELSYDTIDSITGDKGDGFELETKVIFQKPYLDGQLQWVNNLELESESWSPKYEDGTEYAIAARWRSGVAYRFAPNWFIGGEGWVDAEILNPIGSNWEFDHWDAFFGPSIHYGGKKYWATLTAVTQLAGSNEAKDNDVGRHLADHEKHEVRFKLGYNF